MKVLITAEEVVKLAFGESQGVEPEDIGVSSILSAQQKFIKPVVNNLWNRLLVGGDSKLLESYIKPALACYVKYMVLPKLQLSVGSMGIVQHRSSHFVTASDSQLRELRRSVKKDADALMRRAVEEIERNSNLYPEYERAKNILNRCSISSGVIL